MNVEAISKRQCLNLFTSGDGTYNEGKKCTGVQRDEKAEEYTFFSNSLAAVVYLLVVLFKPSHCYYIIERL